MEEKYIMMFEDWNIWIQTELTNDDYESVEVGIMSIVRLSDQKHWSGSEWTETEVKDVITKKD
tara:strand:+ start:45 stop:233 length:189 start_codon:yes stop_codon:yes gene_type:complete